MAGAREEPELPSGIPRISQRVKMAEMKQGLQVEMRGTKIRPVDERLRMKIHPLGEAKQGMRMEMAGMTQFPHFPEMGEWRST